MPNKGVPRPRWTQEEDDVIRATYPDVDECVEALSEVGDGRGREAVLRRAQALGLTDRGTYASWTDEEEATLRKWYPVGGAAVVQAMLLKAGFERTESAICSKANELGVQKAERFDGRWTEEEMDVVREFFPGHSTEDVRRELESRGFDRTAEAINARAQILGVRRKPVRRREVMGETKVVNFVLDTVADEAIIERLSGQRNRSRYIRDLIQRDIDNS